MSDNQLPLPPPFLPADIPPVSEQHPKRTGHRSPPWLSWLAIALTPFVAVCTAVGAYTMAKAAMGSSPPSRVSATAHTQDPKPRKTQPTRPTYDLAGYQAAVSGSEEQAFVAALDQFRSDAKRYKFESLTTDSLSLTQAAKSWLTALRDTSPPPGYQASKLNYMMAATLADRASSRTQSGIAAADLEALAQGAALATRAKEALSRAASTAPHGS